MSDPIYAQLRDLRGGDSRVPNILARLEQLEQAPAAAAPVDLRPVLAALDELDRRLRLLEQTPAPAAGEPVDVEPLRAELDSLRTRQNQLAKYVVSRLHPPEGEEAPEEES